MSWVALLVLLGVAIAQGWRPPGCICPRGCWGPTTACRSNLKNLGTALEMYAEDHQGRYPASLAPLRGPYLRELPLCPLGGSVGFCIWHWCEVPQGARDTYTRGYALSARSDAFTVVCLGHHHQAAGLGPNYPQYTSRDGLRDGSQP